MTASLAKAATNKILLKKMTGKANCLKVFRIFSLFLFSRALLKIKSFY